MSNGDAREKVSACAKEEELDEKYNLEWASRVQKSSLKPWDVAGVYTPGFSMSPISNTLYPADSLPTISKLKGR